jgi:hypothetical protein
MEGNDMRAAMLFLGLFVVACVSGCEKPQGEFGNFANADSVELVRDAMRALSVNFPPAKTRLALVQEAEDAFGSALVETLRARGYAVTEYVESVGKDKYLPSAKPSGLAFAYVIDNRDDELRVSLHIGGEALSRMYRVQRSGDTLEYIPQGFWTRKQWEGGHE